MARRIRLDVEGGLYHLIVRGNDRKDIFHSSVGTTNDFLRCWKRSRRSYRSRKFLSSTTKQESQYRRPDPCCSFAVQDLILVVC